MSKRDFLLSKPLMNAAGSLGFTPDLRETAPWESFGAFVTNPISLRPRRPAAEPSVVEFPGGFLLHSGLPNPGLASALKRYAPKWARAGLPTIVHLMADRPEETARMVRALEAAENVLAVELGFAPQLTDEIILLALEMSAGELPLVVNLPFDQVLRLGAKVVRLGAAAVSIAGPRGLLPRPATAAHPEAPGPRAGSHEFVGGRLFGPAFFAQSLLVLRDAVRAGIPVIGGSGVYSAQDAQTMLATGALAVQVDAALWRGDFIST